MFPLYEYCGVGVILARYRLEIGLMLQSSMPAGADVLDIKPMSGRYRHELPQHGFPHYTPDAPSDPTGPFDMFIELCW